ncbi:MAG: hypothetical protein HN790_04240 [Methylococcales bacterium]|jgi:hypothetical protein|nr:hypothetical protein [Methylococcales bacterium]
MKLYKVIFNEMIDQLIDILKNAESNAATKKKEHVLKVPEQIANAYSESLSSGFYRKDWASNGYCTEKVVHADWRMVTRLFMIAHREVKERGSHE